MTIVGFRASRLGKFRSRPKLKKVDSVGLYCWPHQQHHRQMQHHLPGGIANQSMATTVIGERGTLRRLVTCWRPSIVRKGYWDVWSLVGYSGSSEKEYWDVWSLVRHTRSPEKEYREVWSLDRYSRSSKKGFWDAWWLVLHSRSSEWGYWYVRSLVGHADRQRRGTEPSGHWLDTLRVCSEMLGHWFDTIGRQRRFGHWSLVRHSRSSERGSEMYGHLLVDRCAERGCWSQAPETVASLVIYCFYSYWSNATVSLIWLWHLITILVPRNYLWPTDIKFVPLFSIYFRPVTPVSWLHWKFLSFLFDELNVRTDRRMSATLDADLSEGRIFYHVPI